MTGALLRSATPAVAWVLCGGCAVAAVLGGLQPLMAGAVVPRPAAWLSLVVLSIPASLAIIAPTAATAGGVWTLARWEREGAWLGLRSSGVRGRQLIPAFLLLGLLGGATSGFATHLLGPASRSQIRELGRAPGAVELVPNAELRLGGVQLVVRETSGGWASDLFFASQRGFGTARRGRLVASDGGTAVELMDGVLATTEPIPITLSFRRWVLPVSSSPRVELDELSTEELHVRWVATASAGRDASYERSVAMKRWLHPFAALILPLALLPLGVKARPMAWVGCAGVVYLVAVRLGDQLAFVVGANLAASIGPLAAIAMGLVLWTTWRDG